MFLAEMALDEDVISSAAAARYKTARRLNPMSGHHDTTLTLRADSG